LLAANRPDEAIPRLEHLRSISPADDYVQAALLAQLAAGYLAKGDLGQAAAFIDLAPLQKRNLDAALQACLYLRATVRYLAGDRNRDSDPKIVHAGTCTRSCWVDLSGSAC